MFRRAGNWIAGAVTSYVDGQIQNVNNRIDSAVAGVRAVTEFGARRDMLNEMMNDGSMSTLGEQVSKDADTLNQMADDFMAQREADREAEWQAILEASEDLPNDVPMPPIGKQYLVRGANLHCTYGSHNRKLNLPKCHGVYITGQPVPHKLDSVPGDTQNISTFGVCDSPGINNLRPRPPTVTLKRVQYDQNGDPVETEEDLGNVRGPACTPMIAEHWLNTYDDTRVVDNGDKDPFDKRKDHDDPSKGYPALTTESFLICICGGFIQPLSSGQIYDDVDEFEGSFEGY